MSERAVPDRAGDPGPVGTRSLPVATGPMGGDAPPSADGSVAAGAGAYWTGMVALAVGLAAIMATLAVHVTSVVQTVLLAIPLALVGAGLERLGKSVRRSSLRALGGLLVLVAVVAPVVLSLSAPGPAVNVAEGAPVPAGADQALLRVALGGGQLRVGPGATGLYDVQRRSPAPPAAGVSTSGSVAMVDLRVPGQHGLLARNRGSDWSARLSTSLPWRVEVEAGALTADLDLRDLDVRAVGVDAGISRLAVRLGQPVRQVPVDLQVSAGLVDLYVPRSADLEIRVDGLALNNFGAEALSRPKGATGWRTRSTAGPGRYLVTVRISAGRVRVHRG